MSLSPNIQLLAVAAPVFTFLGILCGLIFGRKKSNAETKKIDYEANNAAFSGYELAMSSMQKHIERLERNVTRLETEQREMRKYICTSADCPHRRR
jgi:hypothetical protein